MIEPTDREELLNELIAESEKDDSREVLLQTMLAAVRRKRFVRKARRSGGILIFFVFGFFVLGIGGKFFSQLSERWLVPRASRERSIEMVTTRPLRPEQMVRTVLLPTESWVKTHQLAAIVSSSATACVVSTKNAGKTFDLMGDAELLALVSPHAGGLLRGPDGAEKLIFPHVADQRGFRLN